MTQGLSSRPKSVRFLLGDVLFIVIITSVVGFLAQCGGPALKRPAHDVDGLLRRNGRQRAWRFADVVGSPAVRLLITPDQNRWDGAAFSSEAWKTSHA